MKKIVTIASVISLAATVAVAREAQPTIEINIDVVQGLVPPAVPAPAVAAQALPPVLKAPVKAKKQKAAKHKKAVHHKKQAAKKPVKEEAPKPVIETPIEKPLTPQIPPVTAPVIPATPETKVETPPAVVAPVATETAPTPAAPVAAETPKVEEKAPEVALPVVTAPTEESKVDELLLKAGEWRDAFKHWVHEKKEAVKERYAPAEAPATVAAKPAEPTPAPVAPTETKTDVPAATAEKDKQPEPTLAPVVEKTPAAPVEPAKQPEAAKVPVVVAEPVAPASGKTLAPAEEVKPLVAPVPVETTPIKADELKKEPEVGATPRTPKVEAQRLQEKVDELLLKFDQWKTETKTWFANAIEPVPATVPAPKVDEKLPEPAATPTPVAVAAPTTATDAVKPEATKEEPTAPANPAPVAAVTTPAAPIDSAKPIEAPLKVLPENVRKPNSPVLYTVLFAGGGDEIAEADIAPLNALSAQLQQEKDLRITVLGSAPLLEGMQESDARKLSLKRAIAVRQLLIKQGVGSNRINVRALGSDTQEVVKDRVDIIKLR